MRDIGARTPRIAHCSMRATVHFRGKPMVLYRRNRVKGGTYFFTVTLLNRKSSLLLDRVNFLREAVRQIHKEMPFLIDAWVVLPEHLHALWTLPSDDDNYSSRWRNIKSLFSQQVAEAEHLRPDSKGRYSIWQPRFWEHTIRDDADFKHHFDYIHYNPVKHGYVASVKDWEYSSFHRAVRQGIYPENWCGEGVDWDGDYGD